MAHDPYAPKRNPAAEIIDHNIRKLPGFMRGRPQQAQAPSWPGIETEPPPISYEVETAPQPAQPEPKPKRAPTDLEQIAAWIERLTWTDMKALASAIIAKQGENGGPLSATQLGDMFEAWAAETMKKHPNREQAA